MDFDPRVSLEGAATALGVLGAALGYVINLVRNWRREHRAGRYRGTRLVILDLLGQHLWTGLTADQLRMQYESDALTGKRKEYRAWPSRTLDRIEFERELKQLQLDFLIDLVGKDHYQVRVRPISSHDMKEVAEARIASLAQSKVSPLQLVDVALRVLTGSPDKYDRRDALRLLVQLSDVRAIDEVIKSLGSSDHQLALDAAGVLAPYVGRASSP